MYMYIVKCTCTCRVGESIFDRLRVFSWPAPALAPAPAPAPALVKKNALKKTKKDEQQYLHPAVERIHF